MGKDFEDRGRQRFIWQKPGLESYFERRAYFKRGFESKKGSESNFGKTRV